MRKSTKLKLKLRLLWDTIKFRFCLMNGIRWIDFMRIYKPDIKTTEAEFLLWERTCFPIGDVKTIAEQLRKELLN